MDNARTDRLRVAVAAVPSLLGDVLHGLLDQRAEVTVIVESTSQATQEPFDLAIVTRASPRPVARLTVVLDEGPQSRGGGIIVDAAGGQVQRLDDLQAVLDLVASLARQAHGTR